MTILLCSPVKYVTSAQLRARGVSLEHFPNAGPRANVTGMRLHYWGKDAYILRHGQYIYKVPLGIYDLF